MNFTTHSTRQDRPSLTTWRLGALAAAAALGLAMALPAQADEAQAIELPSMRTPVTETAPQSEALTRAEVRESLKMARASGTMTEAGEIGDSAAVLQARDDFNALQTEVLQAEYRRAAEQARAQALLDEQPVAWAVGDGNQTMTSTDAAMPEVLIMSEQMALVEQADDGQVLLLESSDDEADVEFE